jgi:hypothetical protein
MINREMAKKEEFLFVLTRELKRIKNNKYTNRQKLAMLAKHPKFTESIGQHLHLKGVDSNNRAVKK